MRVSKDKAAENRRALLQTASRLFRKHGIGGIGVAEIAKEAGLTHGAVYAHFASKEALAAEAFAYGLEGNMPRTRTFASGRDASFDDHLDRLLSVEMRDDIEAGCPMAASASEIGRQGVAVSASFGQTFEEMVAVLEESMGSEVPGLSRRQLAVAAVAAQIGAIAVARAVTKSSTELADEVLESMRETFRAFDQA